MCSKKKNAQLFPPWKSLTQIFCLCLSINTQRETTDSEPYFIILACIQISGNVLFAEVTIGQILNNFKENIEELK